MVVGWRRMVRMRLVECAAVCQWREIGVLMSSVVHRAACSAQCSPFIH